ncbi:hypothetical protein QTP70_009284 [Hemibagrus guttatus]|uniref:Uncharacterized protein n=1 Tax=Hemibagrus guttatus TaxID=175788 RepID=A0AAE0UHX6_9TELE|nr:hypothetical protein QTP70_009284 [Hemibagrus guttatus]
MACTQAELEQQSSQTTSPGHYTPSDWKTLSLKNFSQGVLVPRVLMGTLMLEHGVRYGQAVTSTEVQQKGTTRVQIWGAIPSNHAPPGITVIAHMGVEVPQQNYGVPSRSTFQHPSQGLQEGWVLHTAVRPISRNNSETPIPSPKAQGNNRLLGKTPAHGG